jgi:beta-aspartyl-peptidase (threonine type)
MPAIAVHGGAGDIPPAELTPEREAAYRTGLEQALRAGQAILDAGGPSLDAVVAAVQVLEDNPLFNAGRGAVIAANGICELDASLMDGRDLRAGAVTGLRHVKSPIGLARLVMDRSPHVMLAGQGAEEFALEQGLEPVANRYFVTERRQRELAAALNVTDSSGYREALMGTVGAVALDSGGNLAAATSTGGMTGKRWGRVGDSPVIGAGTYAANDCCAVSATGHGEFFIRATVAHEIASLMRYAGQGVREAADTVVHGQLRRMGGEGGVIAVGRDGTIAMPFNSRGMLRGSIDAQGRLTTGIL